MDEKQQIDQFCNKKQVIGIGVCTIDLIAELANFPQPDQKVRTQSLNIRGGGNATNTLIALSKLGIRCVLITAIGDDHFQQIILSELKKNQIDISQIAIRTSTQSSLTYILVDKSQNTRTCINTPISELKEDEINIQSIKGAQILHLDGRHPRVAKQMAMEAKQQNIKIILDAEKDIITLKDLIPLADFIVINQKQLMEYNSYEIQSSQIEQQLYNLIKNQTNATFVVCTLGDKGSIMILNNEKCQLPFQEQNIFPIKSQTQKVFIDQGSNNESQFTIITCEAIKCEIIVDTVGAGDAFIAGIIYSLLRNYSCQKLLYFSTYMASESLKKQGARDGTPLQNQLPENFK